MIIIKYKKNSNRYKRNKQYKKIKIDRLLSMDKKYVISKVLNYTI